MNFRLEQIKRFENVKFENLFPVAQELLEHIQLDGICLFQGELGSGKTTLIKSFCKVAKVNAPVTSPTFNLLNQYDGSIKQNKIDIFHMDLFRLSEGDMIEDLLFDDLSRHNHFLSLIEWPEKVQLNYAALARHCYHIAIEIKELNANKNPEDLARQIIFSKVLQ